MIQITTAPAYRRALSRSAEASAATYAGTSATANPLVRTRLMPIGNPTPTTRVSNTSRGAHLSRDEDLADGDEDL